MSESVKIHLRFLTIGKCYRVIFAANKTVKAKMLEYGILFHPALLYMWQMSNADTHFYWLIHV